METDHFSPLYGSGLRNISEIPAVRIIKVREVVLKKGDAMDFFNKEMYEKGLRFQKDMMGQYMDAVENFSKFFHNDRNDAEKNNAENVFGTMQAATEAMLKNAGDMTQNMWKSYENMIRMWFDFTPGSDIFQRMNPADVMPVMERFFTSMSVYTKLYDFWKECIADASESIKDPFGAAERYVQKSEELLRELAGEFFKPVMSEDVFSLMESYADLGKTVNTAFSDFMEPWKEKREDFLDCIAKASTGDKESYARFVSLVTDAYQSSFGKLFNMNHIGITKEKADINLQMLDSYVRMMFSYFEIAANVQNILRDANTELWQQVQELLADPEKKLTFKDFYDMWIRVTSAAVNKFYYTDEFADFINEYATNAYDFKIKADKFMESMLSSLPIPTNSEMKSVYKTVYDLRKEVRDLKKEIAELRAELDSLK